jgi:hypothetical protein
VGGTTRVDGDPLTFNIDDIMSLRYHTGLTLILRDTDRDGTVDSIDTHFDPQKAQELYGHWNK